MIAAFLSIEPGLSHDEEKRLADVLSTVACEIMKGEYKAGKVVSLEIPSDDDKLFTRLCPMGHA